MPHRSWRDDETLVEQMGVIDEALAQVDGLLARVRARAEALATLEDRLVARRFAIESKRLT